MSEPPRKKPRYVGEPEPCECDPLPCPICGDLSRQIAARAERDRIVQIIETFQGRYSYWSDDDKSRLFSIMRGEHEEQA